MGRARGELILQRRHGDAEAGAPIVRLRVVAVDAPADIPDLGGCGLDARPRSQACEHLGHPVQTVVFHGRIQVVRTRAHVHIDVGALRIGRRGLEHPDEGDRATVDLHGTADDLRVSQEDSPPILVRQERDRSRLRSIVSRIDRTTDSCLEAHHLEVVPGDDAGADEAWLFVAQHGERHRREFRDLCE